MRNMIESISQQFSTELKSATSSLDLENLKIKFLGKKGLVQGLMKELKDTPADIRPEVGKWINILKEQIIDQISSKQEKIILQEENQRLINEKIDITLPGSKGFLGRKHVITQAFDEIIEILSGMGFTVQYGPDIDTDYYNFEALNFAHDHPARDMQDTFYVSENVLLRTHTSNIQARIMEAQKPPIRIIAPGKVYRN
jgi:phenylalanyl-tRNA synthetase alpha chain